MSFNENISDLCVERTDNDAFRLIWIEKDPDTGARSVFDIMEADESYGVHRLADSHGEIPKERIKAQWSFDPGRATRTVTVVKKIVEQFREEGDKL